MITGTSFTLTGISGELRWKYQQAAVVGAWTITLSPAGLSLEASVISQDEYRMSRPSLTFHSIVPDRRAWVWPVDTSQIANGVLFARLANTE